MDWIFKALRRGRRRLLVWASLAVVAAAIGVAAMMIAHANRLGSQERIITDVPRQGTCGGRFTVIQMQLRAAANAIEGLPGYTGIALLNPCGPIDIYGTSQGLPALMDAAKRAAPTVQLQGHAVANDLTQLLAVQASITADSESLQRMGFKLYEYWPDMTTGLEAVQLIDATPQQLAYIEGRYGRDRVRAISVSNPPRIVPISMRP